MDFRDFFFLFVLFDLHSHSMRHLVLQIHQYLFPYDLTDHKPFRMFCDHIVRKVHRTFFHELRHFFDHVFYVCPFLCRNAYDLLKKAEFLILLVDFSEFIRLHLVDLVDDQDLRRYDIVQQIHYIFVSGTI